MPELDAVQIATQLTEHKEEIGSLKHRMTAAEKVIDEIHNISTSVQLLAQESKSTGDKVDTLTEKVEAIEKKPGEKAEKIKDSVATDTIKIVLSAILGGILALVLK